MKLPKLENPAGDFWGGFAAMLVALPSAIAFGVAIYSVLGTAPVALGAWRQSKSGVVDLTRMLARRVPTPNQLPHLVFVPVPQAIALHPVR